MVEINKPNIGQPASATPNSLTNNAADARDFQKQSSTQNTPSTSASSNNFVANPTANNARIALATQPTPTSKSDASSKNNSKSDGNSASGSGVQTAAGNVNSRTITSKDQEDRDGQQGKGGNKNSAALAKNSSKAKGVATADASSENGKLTAKRASYKKGFSNNRPRLVEKGKALITALDLKAIYLWPVDLRRNINNWRMGNGMAA